MPEIIQFSNDLCYARNGTPLDPLRAYSADRLRPLIRRHVVDGYRKGSAHYAENPPEAAEIVAQICGCIDDPRYAGMTMGVISLQGRTQARLIERMLHQALDPEVLVERRLVCGDAYAFQGDERNVIFLSMVAAPGEQRIGVLANEAARQRFNVAVSRAQDQLWLFHTAELDLLSDKCMRHGLLSYMLDPGRKPTDPEEQRFESKFERHVYQRITARGFHVRTQVSVGDPVNHRYRIDLVVEGMQGRLAVECDGDEWHGPDRYEQDMARQRDLERAGWQFARIRGSDFYRDRDEAMEPVWAELDRLGIRPGGVDESAGEPPVPKPVDNGTGGITSVALTSREDHGTGDPRFESKFERDVYQRIAERGFRVRTQVAHDRYRIDLVVEGTEGRLAADRDGDKSWSLSLDRHEQETKRRRDLEQAGWQLTRIRGSDFYRDPEKAMEPMWAELDRLGIRPDAVTASAPAPPAPRAVAQEAAEPPARR